MKILSNAFSLQMLKTFPVQVNIEEVSANDIPSDVTSAVGHVDTAAVLTDLLGFNIPANRVNVSLESGDVLYVAQLIGGRLPEGTTTLPEGFVLKFLKVTI